MKQKTKQSTEQSKSQFATFGNLFRNQWQIKPQSDASLSSDSDDMAGLEEESKQAIVISPGKKQVSKQIEIDKDYLCPQQSIIVQNQFQIDERIQHLQVSNFGNLLATPERAKRRSPTSSPKIKTSSAKSQLKIDYDIQKAQKQITFKDNVIIEHEDDLAESDAATFPKSKISKNEFSSQNTILSNNNEPRKKFIVQNLILHESQNTQGVQDSPIESVTYNLNSASLKTDQHKNSNRRRKSRLVEQPHSSQNLKRCSGLIGPTNGQKEQSNSHRKRKHKSSQRLKDFAHQKKKTVDHLVYRRQRSKSFLQNTVLKDYNKILNVKTNSRRLSKVSSSEFDGISPRAKQERSSLINDSYQSLTNSSKVLNESIDISNRQSNIIRKSGTDQSKDPLTFEQRISSFIRQVTAYSKRNTITNQRLSTKTIGNQQNQADNEDSQNEPSQNAQNEVSIDSNNQIINEKEKNNDSLDLGQTGGTLIRMLTKQITKKTENNQDEFKENDCQDSEEERQRKESLKNSRKLKKKKYNSFKALINKKGKQNKKKFLIYPDNANKDRWDFFISILLIVSCIFIPYNISFPPLDQQSRDQADVAMYVMDLFFFIDIILTFFTVIYDEEYQQCDNSKIIAKTYLRGWFLIDLGAIFPFELVIKAFTDDNYLLKLTKISRLYRISKLTKLLRMVKFFSNKNRFMELLANTLNFGAGVDRLIMFIWMFFILCHSVCCLFVLLAQMYDETLETTWMAGMSTEDTTQGDLYAIAFYWCITTITTVGYGDISATNTPERWFCSALMVVGVIAFSFANGSLNLILSEVDSKNAVLQDKVAILDKIRRKFHIPNDLYIKCKKNLEYTQCNEFDEMHAFLAELPHGLMVDISLFIYEERYQFIRFFQDKQSSFISWVCPLLRQQIYDENVYIYNEEDDITHVYFMIKGKACFVLPLFQNVDYIVINVGDEFGIIDIVGSCVVKNLDFENWIARKDLLHRQFTVMASQQSEILSLNINDLSRMRKEFFDCYDELFKECNSVLKRAWQLKMRAIKSCRKQIKLKNLGMDDDTIMQLSNKQHSIHSLEDDKKSQQQDMISLKYEGAMNLHQIDEQSLEEVESTSSISESSITSTEQNNSESISADDNNYASKESKKENYINDIEKITEKSSKTSISLSNSNEEEENNDKVLKYQSYQQSPRKSKDLLDEATENSANHLTPQKQKTQMLPEVRDFSKRTQSSKLMNFFSGFQSQKKDNIGQEQEKKEGRHSINISDNQQLNQKLNKKNTLKKPIENNTQVSPQKQQTAVTAKKFLMSKPMMKHKESMKLGKDILNSLATAAKRTANPEDPQNQGQIQFRNPSFGHFQSSQTLTQLPQLNSNLNDKQGQQPTQQITNSLARAVDKFKMLRNREQSSQQEQLPRSSFIITSQELSEIPGDNSTLGKISEQKRSDSGSVSESSEENDKKQQSVVNVMIEKPVRRQLSQSEENVNSIKDMNNLLGSIPNTCDQEQVSTNLADGSQQFPSFCNDTVARRVQKMQKTVQQIQQVEEEQKKLQEKRSSLLTILAQQQDELLQSMNKKKITIEDDSIRFTPGVSQLGLYISNPISERKEFRISKNQSQKTFESNSNRTQTARTQSQINDLVIQQQQVNDYGY